MSSNKNAHDAMGELFSSLGFVEVDVASGKPLFKAGGPGEDPAVFKDEKVEDDFQKWKQDLYASIREANTDFRSSKYPAAPAPLVEPPQPPTAPADLDVCIGCNRCNDEVYEDELVVEDSGDRFDNSSINISATGTSAVEFIEHLHAIVVDLAEEYKARSNYFEVMVSTNTMKKLH